jgi:hypothetical protein
MTLWKSLQVSVENLLKVPPSSDLQHSSGIAGSKSNRIGVSLE